MEESIYEILGESGNFTSDGHKLYYARCKICDDIVENRLSEFKRHKHSKCTHRYLDTDIKVRKLSNKKALDTLNGIIERCYNPKSKAYRFYGAKGIKLCDEWAENTEKFSDWYTNNTKDIPDDLQLSIDRIDDSGDYSPENCRIIDIKENSRWKSTTIPITVNGITMSGRQWSDYLELPTNKINTIRRACGMEYVENYISELLSKQHIQQLSC